jgi:hypothetical protein
VLGRLRPATDWLAPLAADTGSEAFGAGHWETTARRADGSTFPVELTVSRTELDGRAQYVVMFRDNTERRVTQERLQYLANCDSLTGLPDRTLCCDRLGHAMARAPQRPADGADSPGPGFRGAAPRMAR